jgi:hypothetical protein
VSRSLEPKEHGAYGQLALPLAAALAGGRPNQTALCVGAAGVAAFFAHEPLLVVLGRRGNRRLREDGPCARRRLCGLGAIVALTGCVGFVSAPAAVQLLTVVPGGLALLLGVFIRLGREKTAAGELLAAATLSSGGLPVAVASGATMTAAWSTWGGWCIAFASATIAVRTVIAFAREPIAIRDRIAVPLALTASGVVFAIAGRVPAFVMVAFVPTVAIALGLAVRAPSPRHLRQVGWTLMVATTFAAATLVGGSRLHSVSAGAAVSFSEECPPP